MQKQKQGAGREERRLRGMICTLLGGAFWGFSGTCGQFLFSEYGVDSAWLTAVRLLGAGIVLTCMGILTQRQALIGLLRDKRDRWQLLLFGVCGLLFSQYTYLTAIRYSNAATATVLQYLGPVLIMALVCVRGRRWPTGREGMAIVLALVGTWLLATHGQFGVMQLSREGLFWGLMTAVSLACYTLIPARIIRKWGSLVVSGGGMLTGGVVMLVFGRPWRLYTPLDAPGWLAVCGVVLVGTVLAYTLYLQGVGDVGAVRASMLACDEPVSATVISMLWLKTAFQMIDLLGFACIVTTVFLLASREKGK